MDQEPDAETIAEQSAQARIQLKAQPAIYRDVFVCVNCGIAATHSWEKSDEGSVTDLIDGLLAWSSCSLCDAATIWLAWRKSGKLRGYEWGTLMLHPKGGAVSPSEHLSANARELYEEAGAISGRSPRAAGALLRVALQSFLKEELGCDDSDLYQAIRSVVEERGLSPTIMKQLEIVRITGNEASHPGQIDFNENPESVSRLFDLLNYIADATVGRDSEDSALWANLPPSKTSPVDREMGSDGDS